MVEFLIAGILLMVAALLWLICGVIASRVADEERPEVVGLIVLFGGASLVVVLLYIVLVTILEGVRWVGVKVNKLLNR